MRSAPLAPGTHPYLTDRCPNRRLSNTQRERRADLVQTEVIEVIVEHLFPNATRSLC